MLSRCFHFRFFEIFVSSLFLLVFLDFCTYWLSALYNLKADSQEINYDIRKENKRAQRWARSVVTKIGCTNIDWYANIQQDKARWQMAMLESIFYCNFAENLNSATLSFNIFYKHLSNKKLLRILPCQKFHLS